MTTGNYYGDMKSVGIKLLKARLSEYVRLARAGEVILVSDRDEVVAELGPPRHQLAEPGSIESRLERLAASGALTRSAEARRGWRWSPPHLDLGADTVDRLLAELRSER